jgi:SAM-dependent methyltransferase
MLKRLKAALRKTVLFPRWIGVVYIDAAMQRAALHAKGIVLDVGCGARPHEPLLLTHAASYYGVDRPREEQPAAPDVVADAMVLPFRASAVDTVVATELIEHLPHPEAFLREAARVLRPGGVVIVSAPFMEPLHEEPRDFFRFTGHGLRCILERHGFRLLSLEAKGGWWSVVLGSFVNQAIYELFNPQRPDGGRRDNPLLTAMALPLCATAQAAGFLLDKVAGGRRYTLGYVAVAALAGTVPESAAP